MFNSTHIQSFNKITVQLQKRNVKVGTMLYFGETKVVRVDLKGYGTGRALFIYRFFLQNIKPCEQVHKKMWS
jgi:hypothetical protein